MEFLIAIPIISAIIAGIYVYQLVKDMNNVKNQSSASSYTLNNSFKLSKQSDQFLYSNTVKVAKSSQNNTKTSHSNTFSHSHSQSRHRKHGRRR